MMALIFCVAILFSGLAISVSLAPSNPLIRWMVFFFCFFAMLYYSAIPMAGLLVSDGSSLSSLGFTQDQGTFAILMAAGTSVAGISFSLGLRLASKFSFGDKIHKMNLAHNNVRKNLRNPEKIIEAITALSVAVFLVYYQQEIAAAGTYQGNYETIYMNPGFSFAGLWLSLMCAIQFSIKPGVKGWIWGFLPLAWGLYSSNKDPMVLVLLGGLYRLGFFKVATLKRMTLGIIFLTTCVFLILPIFSRFRTPGEALFSLESLIGVSLLKMDMGGPFISLSGVIIEAQQGNTPRKLYGLSYFESIQVLIPKAIYPNRPLDLGEQFARDNIQDWRPGQGLGFSPMAEAIMNFGIIGIPLHYLLFGALIGILWRTFFFLLPQQFRRLGFAFFVILGAYVSIVSHRMPLIGPIKVTLMMMIFAAICSALILLVISEPNKPRKIFRERGL